MNRLENIFKEPNQWGLRGDPYLWTYLKSYFTEHDLPSTKEDFEIKIKEISPLNLIKMIKVYEPLHHKMKF